MLSEEQIEQMAERAMDRLDYRLMNDPTFSQAAYDEAVRDLDRKVQTMLETRAA